MIFTLKKSTESTLRGAKFISQRGSARRNFAKRETRIFTLEKLTVCPTSPILVSYYTSSIKNNHQTRSTSFKEQEEEEEKIGKRRKGNREGCVILTETL